MCRSSPQTMPSKQALFRFVLRRAVQSHLSSVVEFGLRSEAAPHIAVFSTHSGLDFFPVHLASRDIGNVDCDSLRLAVGRRFDGIHDYFELLGVRLCLLHLCLGSSNKLPHIAIFDQLMLRERLYYQRLKNLLRSCQQNFLVTGAVRLHLDDPALTE